MHPPLSVRKAGVCMPDGFHCKGGLYFSAKMVYNSKYFIMECRIVKKLIVQFVKFCGVGGVCFLIDYGLMILLTEVFGLNYLLSCCLSFLISTVVNYLLSMRFVFRSRDDLRRRTEFAVYVLLSAIGLGLTELLMYVAVDRLQIHYMLSKIGVTAIVLVYNFITRKLFLEQRRKKAEE